MANRKVVIDRCDDCPFFDNEYYDYAQTCVKLDREMEATGKPYKWFHAIPDDCSLETTEKKSTREEDNE